jgi:mevalonate kinase
MLKASAPGSVMLLGEHAVLRGYPAVVCAINRRITVTLQPRSDNAIHIHSDVLGTYITATDVLSIESPFEFVLAALQAYKDQLPSGCELTITAEFSESMGLGSSAAVTVATLAVLQEWIEGAIDLEALYQLGVFVVRSVQGMGSGADIAASVFGGTLLYDADIKQLSHDPAITLLYVGYKTPTPEVVAYVQSCESADPDKYADLFEKIGALAAQGAEAIEHQDWYGLAQIFATHQKLQAALGVSDVALEALIAKSIAFPEVSAAKISGSGLGDCIVTLGKLPEHAFPSNIQIDVEITSVGAESR